MYARQDTTLKRLTKLNQKALDKLSDIHINRLLKMWATTRLSLQAQIMSSYRQASVKGKWNHNTFGRVKFNLAASIRSILSQFHAHSLPLVKSATKDLYEQSMLRHAWALDQVMPVSYKVKHPRVKGMREAMLRYPSQAAEQFEARWSSWTDAYNSALVHNLTLNSINEGSMMDAMDEVDATRANTPAYTLIDALERLTDYQFLSAISEGEQSIGDMNEEAIREEIWRTRGDLRVCDDCDANEGQNVDDVGYPPLHPNCHCFTELVPSSFADLLRSGDASDQDLATEMEKEGVVPNALVLRNQDGSIIGKTIVDFEQWISGNSLAISGQ